MLTLFPERGNGSAALISTLIPELEKVGYRIATIFVDTDNTTTSPSTNATLVRDDLLVFQSHPKSRSGTRFVECDQRSISTLIEELVETARDIVASKSVSILHVHHGWIGVIVAKRILDEFGVPYLVHFHGTEIDTLAEFAAATDWKGEIFSQIVEGLRASGKILCASEVQKTIIDQLCKTIGVETTVEVLTGGCDTSTFYYRKRDKPRSPDDRTCLFAGRLVPEKGVSDLLDAFAAISGTSRAKLVICGDGVLAPEVISFSDQMGPSVEFRGFVEDRVALAEMYNNATVVCMPSMDEAFGLVAIEALACGTPLVAYSVGALPSIFSSYRGELAGLLVEKSGVDALTIALKQFLDDGEEEELRILRAARTSELFSIKSTAIELSRIYKNICPPVLAKYLQGY
jgi:glycosyltransferase involved in cell wall biosynthesis